MPMLSVTDLEDCLRAPGGAERRADVLARLNATAKAIQAKMNFGMPTAEFRQAETIMKALVSALRLLAFPPRTVRPEGLSADPETSVPVQGACVHARFFDHAGLPKRLR